MLIYVLLRKWDDSEWDESEYGLHSIYPTLEAAKQGAQSDLDERRQDEGEDEDVEPFDLEWSGGNSFEAESDNENEAWQIRVMDAPWATENS
jgi:hypothetical protein